MLTLQELLNLKSNRFADTKIKLVRHAGGSEQYSDLTKDKYGFLNDQKNQDREVFKDCDYILSFIGMERKRSIFAGCFKVNSASPVGDGYHYDLEPISVFDEFIDRVMIDWGGNSRAWHQWYDKNPKEVVEILPKGYMGNFPGLLNFVLDFDELQKLTANPEANADWRHHLSAVNGIYLILDSNTGQQYIGSACGNEGIWQRWRNYAASKTGGNKELIALLERDSNYQRHFRYSILQPLPSNVTQKEVVRVENLYKEKFGSRAFGLNAN
ncbi:MAG: GIY-YIG nuclease family protein [Rickettsiales bacterium]|nr:GIY-YIG nuclease family protein [Rickettsiales bacterium]